MECKEVTTQPSKAIEAALGNSPLSAAIDEFDNQQVGQRRSNRDALNLRLRKPGIEGADEVFRAEGRARQ